MTVLNVTHFIEVTVDELPESCNLWVRSSVSLLQSIIFVSLLTSRLVDQDIFWDFFRHWIFFITRASQGIIKLLYVKNRRRNNPLSTTVNDLKRRKCGTGTFGQRCLDWIQKHVDLFTGRGCLRSAYHYLKGTFGINV